MSSKGDGEMTIVIVFKNGYELRTKCENVETTTNSKTGRIVSIKYNDIKENQPLDINCDEVLCIYRVLSDE